MKGIVRYVRMESYFILIMLKNDKILHFIIYIINLLIAFSNSSL